MMHISFLTPEYPNKSTNKSGGLGTSIKNLAVELVKKGHCVSIFVYGQNSSEIFDDNGIAIHKIAFKKYAVLSWYFYRIEIQNYINLIIEKEKIDIVEAPDWTGISAFMKLKCPLIIRMNGSDGYFCKLENRKQKWKNYFFEKIALKSADYLISASKFTANETASIFRIKKDIEVIHNGISTDSFFKSNGSIERMTILYFGTLIRKKGVLELARTFNIVNEKNPKAKLVLLGKDSIDIFQKKSTFSIFQNKLSPMAREMVTRVENVPYEEVKGFIAEANVVVLPSFAEAFPMTWLEAMAMEKALVTSDIGWAKELMVDEKTGFTVDPKNHLKFAERIIQILKNEELAFRFGVSARKRIKNHFSQDKIGQKNIEFYKGVLS